MWKIQGISSGSMNEKCLPFRMGAWSLWDCLYIMGTNVWLLGTTSKLYIKRLICSSTHMQYRARRLTYFHRIFIFIWLWIFGSGLFFLFRSNKNCYVCGFLSLFHSFALPLSLSPSRRTYSLSVFYFGDSILCAWHFDDDCK